MNPNAKEFVPAHMRKRQDETAVGSLAKQLGEVDLDETKRLADGKPETSEHNPTTTSSSTNDRTHNQPAGDRDETHHQGSAELTNKETNSTPSDQQHCQRAPYSKQNNNERSKNSYENTNGDSRRDSEEDDRYLLKDGENYCEFNGEQFIVPVDEYEYENEFPGSDGSHPGYDFGNAEDNEDEDVINAYDAFLSELP